MMKWKNKDFYPSAITLLCLCYLLKSSALPPENITLDCGSAESSSFNGIHWTGDASSEFIPPEYVTKTSMVVSTSASKIPRIPYSTARASRSTFVYSFPASPGVKYVRFHFYPASYSGMGHISKARFSVTTGHYTLLDNFTPSITASTLKLAYFTKDYAVNLRDQTLNITFIPSVGVSDAFAFVNGIEILPMFANFYNSSANEKSNLSSIHDQPALEMLYRVNIGGRAEEYLWNGVNDQTYVSSSNQGMVIGTYSYYISYTSWTPLQYAAPGDLYSTARTMGSHDEVNMNSNLIWSFSVDSGFEYFVRLHFCEIAFDVTEVNQRVFKVFINNNTVEKSLDLIALAGKPLVAVYRDYFVNLSEGTAERQIISIALQPNINSKPTFADAILNGIEIAKISEKNGNLGAHLPQQVEKEREKKCSRKLIFGVLGGSVSVILLLSLIIYKLVIVKNPNLFPVKYRNVNNHRVISSECYRQFALEEVRVATNNFSEACIIGEGGFGKVYKGLIGGGVTKVAIKRKNPESHQGVQEFKNEIELLSTFSHTNLVSLLGFCQDDNELILVYDYMACGTLRDHLYNTNNPPLSWNMRLNICIGAARGLHYLHTGTKHTIIHRDIKSTNILLDHDWVAKVSDFGLSRICPSETPGHHYVSTEVKGTFGYLDPSYYRSKRLTEKSDVYSFGVVLFEVLCARPAVKPVVKEDDEKISLAEWALICHQNGTIDRMVDPYLRGKIAVHCLNAFASIAVKCLANNRADRPSMGDVLGNLETALQLQDAADDREDMEDKQLMMMILEH